MENSLEVLHDKSLVVILAYAPTGLGHLRVTDALYHGLPREVHPILLGSQQKSMEWWHRFTRHPWTHQLMPLAQQGITEDLYSFFYRSYLMSHTDVLYQQLVTILDQRMERPKKLLVVSTHFGLTHQIGVLKEKLWQEKNVELILVVVVTDDSPQHLWYTAGADITFVPSHQTKKKLLEFGKQTKLPGIKIEVAPYPVSPRLAQFISTKDMRQRFYETQIDDDIPIHVAVPISGAAAGTTYLHRLMEELHHISSRFHFHVVSKNVSYTKTFLSHFLGKKYVDVYVGTDDREVVAAYEEVYEKNILAFEITKPSEQLFKSLIDPTKRGGVIMLFAPPVGRQEFDNLDFLQRHELVPSEKIQQLLWEKAIANESLLKEIPLLSIRKWRGLRLPSTSHEAARFIFWCLRKNIFGQMFRCRVQDRVAEKAKDEIDDDGVEQIWEQVALFIKNKIKK